MIFLGIGSNLSSSFGDRFENINLAISHLKGYGIQIIKKSNFYETYSYPNKENPKFINIVISVKTHLSPVDLMSVLLFIEEKLERKMNKKNDSRTCDIDIIDYNNHDPKRNRKLLLNKREINKLIGKINREGYTLIPTKYILKKEKQKLKSL